MTAREMPAWDADRFGAIPGPWRSLEQVRAANRNLGHHWFDADSMRFFRTRLPKGMIGGRLFVTSEQFVSADGWADARRYTIRVAKDDGSVETFGEFQEYASGDAARRVAETIVREECRKRLAQ